MIPQNRPRDRDAAIHRPRLRRNPVAMLPERKRPPMLHIAKVVVPHELRDLRIPRNPNRRHRKRPKRDRHPRPRSRHHPGQHRRPHRTRRRTPERSLLNPSPLPPRHQPWQILRIREKSKHQLNRVGKPLLSLKRMRHGSLDASIGGRNKAYKLRVRRPPPGRPSRADQKHRDRGGSNSSAGKTEIPDRFP